MPEPRKPPPPRDPLESCTERIVGYRAAHIEAVRAALAKLAVYVPKTLLRQALQDITDSANTLVWDCERVGEDYPGLRATVKHTPPDPDRVPERRRAPFDDELTPVVGPHGRRMRAERNQR